MKPIISDFPENPNDSEIENLSESEPEQENDLDSSSSSASISDDEPVSSKQKTVKKRYYFVLV